MSNYKKINLLAILLIIIISIGITNKTFQNDTFYIIKVGESILKNGIDMIDHFSIHNIMYPYEHWLYNILIFLIYNKFGFTGLYISNIFFTLIIGLIMYFGTSKLYKNNTISLIITIISLFLLRAFIATRVQMISYIIFLLEVLSLEYLFKYGNKINILFLFILSVLLANTHAAAWPMFFILFLPYIVEYLFFILKKRKNKILNNVLFNNFLLSKNYNNIKYIFISFILCILGGFINPNNNQCFVHFIKLKIGNTLNIISEHQPTILYTEPLFLIYLLSLLFYILLKKQKYKLKNVFFILGLLVLSLSSYRHIALFCTIGSFILVESFSEKAIKKLNRIKIFLFIVPFTILTSAIIFYLNIENKYISNNYPKKAINFINKNIDKTNMRIYNEYDYGSLLIFNNIPVFIDSRASLYTKPFNKLKNDIFDNYMKVNSTGHYKKVFKKYKINYVLIKRYSILDYSLKCDQNYKIIYKDKKYILYKKI